MTRSSATLSLLQVRKSFDEHPVIRDVDLDVPPGTTLALIGPSGCGKSTLLRLMNGLLQPDRGKVQVKGERLVAQNLLSLRRRMGYVIQEGGLFPHLDARQNITLMADHLAWKPERIESRLLALLQLTHLETDLLQRFPFELSGGQRQRVALMRALMLDPEILLLDEPLGALDPIIRFDLQKELKGIFQALGKTVVLVTHDLSEAAYLADEVLLLHEGRIAQRGHMSDLVHRPADAFVERFVKAQRGHDWSAL